LRSANLVQIAEIDGATDELNTIRGSIATAQCFEMLLHARLGDPKFASYLFVGTPACDKG
jgi:hypothetical protein